ncbi:MAG: hypothetical protein H6613_03485 [Ignavibacteriales bacterium]|nr:hypothetical protein [Ignavibacteriales bacterium]
MKNLKIISLSFVLFIMFSSCKDSSVEPAQQFIQIYFKYYHKNELNTFDQTYQKDLVLDGTIKVKFWLTTEEQNKILNKANEIDFFSFPEIFPSDTGIIIFPNPGDQVLRIKTDNEDHQTQWTILIDMNDDRAIKLIELNDLIISLIELKPEYKKLPPAKGGYV